MLKDFDIENIVSQEDMYFDGEPTVNEIKTISEFNDHLRKELIDGLHTGEIMVKFRKKNGELRVMRCTLTDIPEEHLPTGRGGEVTTEVLRVFDLDKQEWRSFRIDSVIFAEWLMKDEDGEICVRSLEILPGDSIN